MKLDEILKVLKEYEMMGGPGMGDMGSVFRPDTSGDRLRGAQRNWDPLADKLPDWPYDSQANAGTYGVPTGPRGIDRGTPMGTNVSGEFHGKHYGEESSEKDWGDDVAGDVEKAGDVDENLGGFPQGGAPMDGPQNSFARNARPIEGNEEELSAKQPNFNYGNKNMWGGGNTIPGTTSGGANSPNLGNDMGPWKIPQDNETQEVEECGDPFIDLGDQQPGLNDHGFTPYPPPTENVTNPNQFYEKNMTDEEIENDLNRIWGQEDNHNFDDGKESNDDSSKISDTDIDGEGGFGFSDIAAVLSIDSEPAGVISVGDEELPGEPHHSSREEIPDMSDMSEPDYEGGFTGRIEPAGINIVPRAGNSTDFMSSPIAHGAARGTYGMHTDGKGTNDMVDKASAWDVMQKVVAAMSPQGQETDESLEEGGIWNKAKKGLAGLALGASMMTGGPAAAAEPVQKPANAMTADFQKQNPNAKCTTVGNNSYCATPDGKSRQDVSSNLSPEDQVKKSKEIDQEFEKDRRSKIDADLDTSTSTGYQKQGREAGKKIMMYADKVKSGKKLSAAEYKDFQKAKETWKKYKQMVGEGKKRLREGDVIKFPGDRSTPSGSNPPGDPAKVLQLPRKPNGAEDAAKAAQIANKYKNDPLAADATQTYLEQQVERRIPQFAGAEWHLGVVRRRHPTPEGWERGVEVGTVVIFTQTQTNDRKISRHGCWVYYDGYENTRLKAMDSRDIIKIS